MFQEMERQNKLGKFEHWDSSDVSMNALTRIGKNHLSSNPVKNLTVKNCLRSSYCFLIFLVALINNWSTMKGGPIEISKLNAKSWQSGFEPRLKNIEIIHICCQHFFFC
jgi:hypothetical protein